MADYAMSFARSARKELEALEANLISRIFSRIEALTEQPRPSGCRKLVGQGNLWRIRVGDYRVIYEIDDTKRLVDVIGVRHRSKAYD
jgi:mRNA interferase RelE/StbE